MSPESKRRRLEAEDNGATAVGTSTARVKRTGFDWYENVLGAPRFICAPMVDQSEVAYRALCVDYGTDLCYTPMINSKSFIEGGKKNNGRNKYIERSEHLIDYTPGRRDIEAWCDLNAEQTKSTNSNSTGSNKDKDTVIDFNGFERGKVIAQF